MEDEPGSVADVGSGRFADTDVDMEGAEADAETEPWRACALPSCIFTPAKPATGMGGSE